MNAYQTDSVRGFDLLSQLAQQRLRARVADAGGDIGSIMGEIRAQLDELDRAIDGRPEAVQRQQQADRAFFVAQLTYLDLLLQAEAQPEAPRKRGLLARLRTALGRTPAVE
jgi:hypothetical protein